MLTNQEQQDDRVAGVLTLDLIGAQNLPHNRRLPNPFTVISYGGRAHRTRWHKSTANPSWSESLQLVVKRSELERYLIVLSVYDYDRIGYNQCLGTTNVRVKLFYEHPEEQLRLALMLENDNQDSLLLIKGQFKTMESLEVDFWREIAAECQDTFDTMEVSELKNELIETMTKCPYCRKQVSSMDAFEHLIICNQTQKTADYVTEEYASRKWFSRIFEMLGFGGYRIGHNNGHILVHDRQTGRTVEERIPLSIKLAIRWMHVNTVNRQAIDWPVIRGLLHRLTLRQGLHYDSEASAKHIADFVKYHKLNMDEVELKVGQFKTFNEFFYRRLLPGSRPVELAGDDGVMSSPADCRMHCYQSVNDATRFWIKGRHFTIPALLGNDTLEYNDNTALLIARLAPQDYHRFHSPITGTITSVHHIPGAYFTVNPMAVRQDFDIFTENTRSVIMMDSDGFGRVAVIPIGAMMVGSIRLGVSRGQRVQRGDEMGYFAFGGSTVVVVCDRVVFDKDLVKHSRMPIETLVRVGERIGVSLDHH